MEAADAALAAVRWRIKEQEAGLERILRDAMITDATPNGLFTADHPVRLAPGRDVPWSDVVAAFRAVTGAGYRSIAFGGGA